MNSGILTIEDLPKVGSPKREEIKRRCQTNIAFLANRVLRSARHPELVPRVHDPIISAFPTPVPYVHPNEWSKLTNYICLSPRNTQKSVIGIVWATAAILSYPDLRLLIISGQIELAETICLSIQRCLRSPVLLELFPQYRPAKEKMDSAEHWCAARSRDNNDRDATIATSSLYSAKAGKRCDLMWMDDVIGEQQKNEDMQVKALEQVDDCDPILEPGGKLIYTGTRWLVDDLPSKLIERGEDWLKESGRPNTKVVSQRAWTVKDTPEAKAREAAHMLQRGDVEFLSRKLDTDKVWALYRNNYADFCAQYLMDPQPDPEQIIAFPPGLIDACTVEDSALFGQYDTYANFDLNGEGDAGDDTCGLVAHRDPQTGELLLIDGVLDRLSSAEMVAEIVKVFRWPRLVQVRIEEANGASRLKPEILRVAKEYGLDGAMVEAKLIFQPANRKKNSKKNRVLDLAAPFGEKKIRVWKGLPIIAELKKQLTKFTGGTNRKDDAPDCLGQLYEWLQEIELPEMDAIAKPRSALILSLPPIEEFLPDGPVPMVETDTRDDTENQKKIAADVSWQSPYTLYQ